MYFTLKKLITSYILWVIVIPSSTIAEAIHIANGEWPPYHSKKLKHYGFASHIITLAFAEEGMSVKYDFLPWKRGMYMAKQGKLDGTAVWRKKDEFQKYFYYSEPIFETETVFFHLKSLTFHWKKFSDLKGLVIGGTIGYGYNKDYDLAEKSNQYSIKRVISDEINFHKLILSRIDIFPITKEVGYHILKTKFPSKVNIITHHPTPLTPEAERSLHLLISKKSRKHELILKSFNRGLKKLREKGKLTILYNNLEQGKYIK
ncbi:substrate-binding periplasmic protein [Spartinivicinus poritis]|uniref:Transporter substrate-binding domain-containing protein n=1 Tax=Spartinivicinus poritis TaxID=2994640 RepID=A0ABT5U8P5_9GAMM|nr:transporter substrate-binding domain-containing protein [Spartinivicinus sp. A2-2]MDE1462746.1 transporter substrate-binding domain-containing protein [Spartinivicinus sp. A2-2]